MKPREDTAAVRVARRALQAFFGEDKTGFRDMTKGGRPAVTKAVEEVLAELADEEAKKTLPS